MQKTTALSKSNDELNLISPLRRTLLLLIAFAVGILASTAISKAATPINDPVDDTAASRDETKPNSAALAASGDVVIGVAVIDLNRVAIGLGKLPVFEKEITEHRKFLEEQVRMVDAKYVEDIKTLEQAVATGGTKAQNEELILKKQERQVAFTEAKREAGSRLNEFEQSVKRRFMDEVRPIAYDVAQRNGFGIVLTVPQVFAFRVDSNQDITERVIDRMRANNPQKPAADLPRLATPKDGESTKK